MFKPLALATLLALSLVPPLAQANDTPTMAAEPTVAERLASARSAIQAKRWKDAINELTLASRDAPRNADLFNLLGYSLRKQATPDLPKAFEAYKQALKLNPNHRGAHEYIGEAYLMAGQPAEAEKHLADLERICGNKACEEYADLAKALAAYKARK